MESKDVYEVKECRQEVGLASGSLSNSIRSVRDGTV